MFFIHWSFTTDFLILYYSCIGPEDDVFRPCFSCTNFASETDFRKTDYDYDTARNSIDRQTGEMFQATERRQRLICQSTGSGARRCRLRVDKLAQFRSQSYERSLRFVQAEEYLSEDDLDIIRYYKKV